MRHGLANNQPSKTMSKTIEKPATEADEPHCPLSTGPEPLRIKLSREEIEDKAKAYLLEYVDGTPNDDFYLRRGMMVDFSHFLFQNAKVSDG